MIGEQMNAQQETLKAALMIVILIIRLRHSFAMSSGFFSDWLKASSSVIAESRFCDSFRLAIAWFWRALSS